MTRIPIKRAPWAIPVLVPFGATARNSWVQVGDGVFTARFGWYRVDIPLEDIVSAEVDNWPWFGGYGWRTDFRARLGLIGALSPVVRIHLREPRKGRLLGIPIRYRDLYVSVDEPATLQAALAG